MNRSHQEVRRYVQIFYLGILAFIIESVGGYFSGSIALFADAGHMFMDNASVLVSIAVATQVGRSAHGEEDSIRRKGGYMSAFLLYIIAVGTFVSACCRLVGVHEVKGWDMLVFALVSGIINYFQHLKLHNVGEDEKQITHTALHKHILSDMMQGFGVAFGGLLINVTGWYIIDPLISFWISYRMFRWAWEIWKQSSGQKSVCGCSHHHEH